MLHIKLSVFCCYLFLLPSLFLTAERSPEMVASRVMESNANYGTHMAALITAVVNTRGPILELGCGDFSTPLLHAICATEGRFLVTAESNKEWQNLFYDLQRDWHQFRYVSDWDDWNNIGSDVYWSVVFIDHAPVQRRIVDIERLRSCTDVFVIHDTEQSSYGYEPLLSTFRFRFTYRRYKKTTTLVSDTIDVASFFKD